ncbi:hypothetical protein EU528_10010 [Candidatus Thorarchaeota archaeon]|nr:MAG: hypothetical protein EU528_10010 [Candidatus Thorarchaeota archaeon]
MLTKKQFMLLFCVFLFAAVIYQTQSVEALPFDNEYTDQSINPGEYLYDDYVLTTGDVLSGYFETVSETQGLDFFICDEADFIDWDGGGSATEYESATNMHTYGFSFTAPYSDTWYVVFDNTDGSLYITIDTAIDVNGDNTPFYSTSAYTYTEYGVVLEDEEYYFLSYTFSEGTVVGGHFSTFFSTDGLDFFICDESNFDDWVDGFTATGYSIEDEMHTSTIDDFTIPTTGTWYFVFYAENEVDTLTFSCGIEVDTSGVGSGIGDIGVSFIGIGALLLILLICCCVCRSRSKKKEPEWTQAPPTVDHYRAPVTPTTTTITQREIVRDRVLVICPYCGAKNEQGILRCHSCNAEL